MQGNKSSPVTWTHLQTHAVISLKKNNADLFISV
jgi:hypothetical protein